MSQTQITIALMLGITIILFVWGGGAMTLLP